MNQNFQTSLSVESPMKEVFSVISSRIPQWWSSDFEGSSDQKDAEFTVRFGNTFKTMKIESIEPGKEIVWRCIDQHLEMPDGMAPLSNKKEWVGNRLVWSFTEDNGISTINLVHEGLTPEVECWGVCEQGWDQTFISIKNLIQTGKGNPFVMLDEIHLKKAKAYKS